MCGGARAREGVTSFAGRYNTEPSLCNRGVDFARETLEFGWVARGSLFCCRRSFQASPGASARIAHSYAKKLSELIGMVFTVVARRPA